MAAQQISGDDDGDDDDDGGDDNDNAGDDEDDCCLSLCSGQERIVSLSSDEDSSTYTPDQH